MQKASLLTPVFHLNDLAVKGYKPVNGLWDMVTIVGEIPKHKILLTFHGHHMNMNLTSRLTEWNTLDFSINKEYELQGQCRAVHIIHSNPPRLLIAKRKEVELYTYILSGSLELIKRIPLETFFEDASYYEVQKLSLEHFGLFGIAAFARGLNKGLHKVYDVRFYNLKGNKYVKKLKIKQESSMVVPLVFEKKSIAIIGTGKNLNIFQVANWRLTKRLKVPSDDEVIFDIKYLKTRDLLVVYTKSEEDMSREPKLFFWQTEGLRFIKGPVKWIAHNISKNFFVFDGFDYFFSFASQTKVLFQNIRGVRKEMEIELPIKSSGCSLYKIIDKNRILCICRNQSKFYLALITYST